MTLLWIFKSPFELMITTDLQSHTVDLNVSQVCVSVVVGAYFPLEGPQLALVELAQEKRDRFYALIDDAIVSLLFFTVSHLSPGVQQELECPGVLSLRKIPILRWRKRQNFDYLLHNFYHNRKL